jgi:hypothetical protein
MKATWKGILSAVQKRRGRIVKPAKGRSGRAKFSALFREASMHGRKLAGVLPKNLSLPLSC